MPDWGTNPANGLFFARFEYIRDFPTPQQSGIIGSKCKIYDCYLMVFNAYIVIKSISWISSFYIMSLSLELLMVLFVPWRIAGYVLFRFFTIRDNLSSNEIDRIMIVTFSILKKDTIRIMIFYQTYAIKVRYVFHE